MEPQNTLNWQSNLVKKKNNARGIKLPGFKTYYKPTVTKTAWYWNKDKHTDLWNRTEHPEINPNTYGQLIFKRAKTTHGEKKMLFNKWCGDN